MCACEGEGDTPFLRTGLVTILMRMMVSLDVEDYAYDAEDDVIAYDMMVRIMMK